jgi:hypothetical protein
MFGPDIIQLPEGSEDKYVSMLLVIYFGRTIEGKEIHTNI